MRPIAVDQDYIRNPLNSLLGTPANVRLLRMLSEETSEPIGAPDAADQTGLTETGARRALKRLAKTGFVERLGGGRAQTFRLRDADPLIRPIIDLFRAEHDRYQKMLRRLREIFNRLPEIRTAWIDEFPIQVGQPLHIGLIADSTALTYLREEIRQRIVEVEEDYDLTIEVHAFSRAEVPTVDWSSTTILSGVPMPEQQAGRPIAEHSERTASALTASQGVAEFLDKDPTLLRRAQRHLEYLLQQDQGPASHDLREWLEILKHYSRERIREFLVADTPRAQRLRQSSPFFAVLSADERAELLKMVAQDDT